MRDEAKTWWLVSGPDMLHHPFFFFFFSKKIRVALELNHEIPAGCDNNC